MVCLRTPKEPIRSTMRCASCGAEYQLPSVHQSADRVCDCIRDRIDNVIPVLWPLHAYEVEP
jgi:hypothetical protein